ncbi:MAG: hypothetical protein HQL76_09805 [Magnetococcales bacterium]|nr:hypothetical protein [Magnetococcales bacterium]
MLSCKYVKTLKTFGFDEKQAEALAEAQTDLLDHVEASLLKELATKRDIAELKAETIKWMFGIAAGQAMFIIAILKMFPAH